MNDEQILSISQYTKEGLLETTFVQSASDKALHDVINRIPELIEYLQGLSLSLNEIVVERVGGQ